MKVAPALLLPPLTEFEPKVSSTFLASAFRFASWPPLSPDPDEPRQPVSRARAAAPSTPAVVNRERDRIRAPCKVVQRQCPSNIGIVRRLCEDFFPTTDQTFTWCLGQPPVGCQAGIPRGGLRKG